MKKLGQGLPNMFPPVSVWNIEPRKVQLFLFDGCGASPLVLRPNRNNSSPLPGFRRPGQRSRIPAGGSGSVSGNPDQDRGAEDEQRLSGQHQHRFNRRNDFKAVVEKQYSLGYLVLVKNEERGSTIKEHYEGGLYRNTINDYFNYKLWAGFEPSASPKFSVHDFWLEFLAAMI